MPVPPKTNNPVIFADEVFVSFTIKKDKGNKRKDGYIRLSFYDNLRKEVLSEIVISPVTAEALANILQNTLRKLDETIDKDPEIKKDETSYIA